jgi:hypothetical protein
MRQLKSSLFLLLPTTRRQYYHRLHRCRGNFFTHPPFPEVWPCSQNFWSRNLIIFGVTVAATVAVLSLSPSTSPMPSPLPLPTPHLADCCLAAAATKVSAAVTTISATAAVTTTTAAVSFTAHVFDCCCRHRRCCRHPVTITILAGNVGKCVCWLHPSNDRHFCLSPTCRKCRLDTSATFCYVGQFLGC